MERAANLLPSTIEEATKGTPIAVLLQVVPRENIEAFLAVELTKLASMVNVDERLNIQPHQTSIIASELVQEFRGESLADFKICFQRGRNGRYDDKLLHLDSAVIGNWMRRYLEEKYIIVEAQLMAEKESFYRVKRSSNIDDQPNPERNLLSLFETILSDKVPGNIKQHLTPEEIKEIEDSKNQGTPGIYSDTNNKRLNEYNIFRMEREDKIRQIKQKLHRASSDFYGDRMDIKNFQIFEDENGFSVIAENALDAEVIYKSIMNAD